MKNTEDELNKEKLRHEIKSLKRSWIQPTSALIGLAILLISAVNTNVQEFFKVNSLEVNVKQANKKLDSVQVILHFTIDSLNKLNKAFYDANRLIASYNKNIKTATDTIKNKDVLISYLKNQLDMLIQHKVLNKELGGSFSNDYSNDYDNGFILTTDDGQPIILHENKKSTSNKKNNGK